MTSHQALAPGWVYSLADYRQMFDLREKDLVKKIFDYPGGISSFNAEMRKLGYSILSGDEIYDLTPDEIKQLAKKILEKNIEHLHLHKDKLRDKDQIAMDGISAVWSRSTEFFLADYAEGLEEKRYQAMQLPHLPFTNAQFDIALCSDLLFHTQAIKSYNPTGLVDELCRIAKEVRVFPLLDEKGEISTVLGPLMMELQQKNLGVEVREVSFEQLKGGNAMLRIWTRECVVE